MTMLNEDSKVMPMANVDLIWSLYHDKFVTFGNELKLYVVDKRIELSQIHGGIQLAELSYSNIITSKADVRYVKSMACNNTFFLDETDLLFAFGYQNGKVVINSFDSSSKMSLIGKEFVPNTSRACNALDFCQIDNNLLASGFDKHKNENSAMVWDLAHTGSSYAQGATLGVTKPLFEFASNEIVHSLRWFQNKSIICGLNNKHIKLYDIRDAHKQTPCAFTKGVYGLALDPFSNYRFASFFENNIYIWDLRSFENPLTTIGPESSSIMKLEWCPTRSNVLAAILKDTNNIKIYEYKDYKNLNDLPEPSIISRDITPFEVNNLQIISSFSWHPSNEFQMTIVGSNGMIRDFKVVDRITLNWSPTSEIIWTHGKKILQFIDSRDSIYKEMNDIAEKMRMLAESNYGVSSDKLWQLFEKKNPLYSVWKWVCLRVVRDHDSEKNKGSSTEKPPHSISYTNDVFSEYNSERFLGIFDIIKPGQTNTAQNETIMNFPDSQSKKKISISIERSRALQHCGWSKRNHDFLMKNESKSFFDDSMPCEYFVKSNEVEHNYTRVAAVMIFNGKIDEAIQCLNRASNFENKLKIDNEVNKINKAMSLSAIALALSAFSTTATDQFEKNKNLWIETFNNIKPKLDDPYLKAIFTFILIDFSTEASYYEILDNTAIDIADRIAFACMYLSFKELSNFLISLKESLVKNADLQAIYLTGISIETLDLFSKYVEKTCDVQTVSLILLWTLKNSICSNIIAQTWIDNYKQLLDCWRLWSVRAQFDIKWYAGLNHLEEPRQQIYAVCNYCRSPISAYIPSDLILKSYPQPMSHLQYNRASTANSSKLRTCSCSNCGKTLPRCSLCLTQMGTPAGIYWRPGLIFSKNDRKLTPFSSWFTWCQKCRHGGHSSHILDWFTENNICPVAGCKCKCKSLDANAKLILNANL